MEASSNLGQTASAGPVDKTSKIGEAMRLYRLLAATLAAFFVVGCSSEKSTSPKALASAGPQPKPRSAEPRNASALPPRADPPTAATASLPTEDQDPAKDNPPAPPDPWAGIDVEWVPVYKDFAKLLEPIVKAGGAAVQAGFQPRLSEDEERWFAVRQLGQCKALAQSGARDKAACPFGQSQRHGDQD